MTFTVSWVQVFVGQNRKMVDLSYGGTLELIQSLKALMTLRLDISNA